MLLAADEVASKMVVNTNTTVSYQRWPLWRPRYLFDILSSASDQLALRAIAKRGMYESQSDSFFDYLSNST
jgi:hypothetical protein